jgi:hypothetical protein
MEVKETVEQAAENWLEQAGGATAEVWPDFINAFINGAQWQKEHSIDRDKVIDVIEKHILYPALVGGKENNQKVAEFKIIIEEIKKL